MRYIDARHAALLEAVDQFIETVGVDLAQAARRLVEHDDTRAAADGRRDLHDLLLRRRQLTQRPQHVELDADLGEHRAGAARQLAALDESALGRKRRETQILGDREVGAERELLVHHADAGGKRVARSAECDLASVDEQSSAVGRVDAGENLPERALPGAILAAERVARAARRSRARRRPTPARPESAS